MRLDKYLSVMNVASRSELKQMIRKGQVTADGIPVKKPDQKVDPGKTLVQVNGEDIPWYEQEYYLLHKPGGVVTAVTDNREKTVMELLPKIRRTDLSPVGRLDKDTEGLLLITSDGQLAHRLLAPRKHVDKTYYAEVSGIVTDETSEHFKEGVDIGDETRTAPADLVIESSGEISRVRLTITEGRFHQVKRMFQAEGMEVLYLKRLSMGPLSLPDDLPKGNCRHLTENEIEKLRDLL